MSSRKNQWRLAVILPFSLIVAACGGGTDKPSDSSSESGLTEFQLEHGIGPVTDVVTLPALDDALADSGETSFNMKCAACHKMDDRYVGPPLRGITARRSPAYILNMVLNPDEMINTHPEAHQLLAEYMTMMPNQNLELKEARSILEYLRRSDAEAPAASE